MADYIIPILLKLLSLHPYLNAEYSMVYSLVSLQWIEILTVAKR